MTMSVVVAVIWFYLGIFTQPTNNNSSKDYFRINQYINKFNQLIRTKY